MESHSFLFILSLPSRSRFGRFILPYRRTECRSKTFFLYACEQYNRIVRAGALDEFAKCFVMFLSFLMICFLYEYFYYFYIIILFLIWMSVAVMLMSVMMMCTVHEYEIVVFQFCWCGVLDLKLKI